MMAQALKVVVVIKGGAVYDILSDGDVDVLIVDRDMTDPDDRGYAMDPEGNEGVFQLHELDGNGLGSMDAWFDAWEKAVPEPEEAINT